MIQRAHLHTLQGLHSHTHTHVRARCCPRAPHPRTSLLNRSFLLSRVSFGKHAASLKLGSSRMPIKYDECMKRTAELELCHLAAPREGSEKEKEEILILHAPRHLVNIFFLEMYIIIISFDLLYDLLSAAKIKHMKIKSPKHMRYLTWEKTLQMSQ